MPPSRAATSTCARTWPLPLLLGWLLVLLLAVPLAPERWHLLHYAALPPWPVLAAALLFAAIAVATRAVARRAAVHVLLAAAMVPAYAAIAVQPLGDIGQWRLWAHQDLVPLSEMLANVAFHVACTLGGDRGIDLVAPLGGFVFALVFLHVCERTLVARAPRRAAAVRLQCAAVLLLSGSQLFWFRGYVENSFLSLPALLLALQHLDAYAGGTPGAPGAPRALHSAALYRAALYRAALWLGFAILLHGMHVALLPALPLCIALRHPPHRAWRAFARANAAAFACTAGVVLLGVLLQWLAGFRLVPGHLRGGSDDAWFVPLDPAATAIRYAFGMFSRAHAAEVGNAVLLASPLVPCILLLALRRRPRAAMFAAVRRRPALAIAALGGIGIASLYYFDLGFPGDYDLMVSMCAPVALCLLQLLAALPAASRRWTWLLLLLGGGAAWAVAGGLLVPLPGAHPLGAQGLGNVSEHDVLKANGRADVAALRPFEPVLVELALPRECTPPVHFAIYGYRGRPAPAAPGENGTRGLAFPDPSSPHWNASRVLVIVDATSASLLAAPAPELTGRWISPQVPVEPAFGTVTIQAVLRDAAGREWVSNAVIVEPPAP